MLFKQTDRGLNRSIGRKPCKFDNVPLSVLIFSTKIKVINKEKEAKRKLQQ
jgi:hypothetical protein